MARFPILLVLLFAAVAASAQPVKGGGLRVLGLSADELAAETPSSPNPFLAFLEPGVEPDFEYWTAKTAFDGLRRARTRAARGMRSTASGTYRERERAVFNRNDGLGIGDPERIPRDLFGSASAEPIVEITGTLEPPVANPTRVAVDTEDAASGAVVPFRVAVTPGSGTVATARIGDGPFAASGDVDVYDITIPQAGTYVEIGVRTPTGDLDPKMSLYDPAGQWVVTVDDSEGLDPVEGRVFERPGTYRLYVYGYVAGGDGDLANRTNAGSARGVGSTGPYELHVSSATPDVDSYAVDLEAGDVFGVATSAPVEDVVIYGPDGSVRMRSQTDISGLYPDEGPLLSPSEMGAFGRGITAATIAPVAGTYVVSVTGEGSYTMIVQGARPGHERPGGQAVQTLYVEFDGGTYYPSRELNGTRDTTTLSPLRSFLPRWGLTAADEDAVIDAFLATLRRVLRDDLRMLPGMGDLDLRILNDRDHPDPGPDANRLIVAGSSDEIGGSGFLGQASSVDVGNFRQNDVAYILLDSMSDPAAVTGSSSINQFAVAPGRTKAELVGLGVGTVAAHEAGHFFGLHHTENENAVRNVQDAGGYDLARGFDIGADRVFGPGDGDGVAFRIDDLYTNHAFSGVQRSPEALALGLHSVGADGGTGVGLASAGDLLRSQGYTLPARQAATAQSRRARLSLVDAFGSDANRWTWRSQTSASASVVQGGALRITADGGKTLRVPFKNTGGAVGSDFAARFDLRFAGGCEANGVGALVRFADGAYTAAMVDAQGDAWSTVDRWTGSGWDTIAGWERTDALASDDWNTIEAVVLGTRLTLIANGQVIRTTSVPAGSGVSGLVIRGCDGAGDAMSYDVDNLAVVALDAPGMPAFGGIRSLPGGPASPAPVEIDGTATGSDG